MLALVIMVVAGGGGYCLGRYIIGEKIIRQGAAPIRSAGPVGRVSQQAEQAPEEPERVWAGEAEEPNAVGPEEWRPAAEGGTRVRINEREQTRSRLREQSVSRDRTLGRTTDAGPPRPVETQPKARPRRFTLQVGAFLDERNTRLLVEDLNNRGYRASVRTDRNPSGAMHRVQTGSFTDEAAARRAADALRREGYTAVITSE